MTSAPAKSAQLHQPTEPTLDQSKAEAFAQKMLDVFEQRGTCADGEYRASHWVV